MSGVRNINWDDDEEEEDDLDRLFQSSQTANARLEREMSANSRSRRQLERSTLQPARQSSRRNQQRERPPLLPNTSTRSNPSTSRTRTHPVPSTSNKPSEASALSSSRLTTPSSSRAPSSSATRTPSYRVQTRISRLESSFNQSESAEDVNRAALQQRITAGRAQASLRSQSRNPNPALRPSSSRDLQTVLNKSTPRAYVAVNPFGESDQLVFNFNLAKNGLSEATICAFSFATVSHSL